MDDDSRLLQALAAIRAEFRDGLKDFREEVMRSLNAGDKRFDMLHQEIGDLDKRIVCLETAGVLASRKWPNAAVAAVSILVTVVLGEMGYIVNLLRLVHG